jgi:nitroimidazol reductase NimA-like FMN-containing flavoprotein (pyridoxamine 5'-phosphate oxidase superfamily)
MRRKDKEITTPEIINEILQSAEFCNIGLVDKDEAYIVPVNFAYHNGDILVHSAANGRKIEILTKNNKVSFQITHQASIQTGPNPCNWTTRYRSLMGKGTLKIETDKAQKTEALDRIMIKYGWKNGEIVYDEASLSRICILKLHIESISGKQSGNW